MVDFDYKKPKQICVDCYNKKRERIEKARAKPISKLRLAKMSKQLARALVREKAAKKGWQTRRK